MTWAQYTAKIGGKAQNSQSCGLVRMAWSRGCGFLGPGQETSCRSPRWTPKSMTSPRDQIHPSGWQTRAPRGGCGDCTDSRRSWRRKCKHGWFAPASRLIPRIVTLMATRCARGCAGHMEDVALVFIWSTNALRVAEHGPVLGAARSRCRLGRRFSGKIHSALVSDCGHALCFFSHFRAQAITNCEFGWLSRALLQNHVVRHGLGPREGPVSAGPWRAIEAARALLKSGAMDCDEPHSDILDLDGQTILR